MEAMTSTSGNESTPDPNPNPPLNGEKKRKKKGWKGWALVIEDAEGNIIEVNDGPKPEPLPPRRPKPITSNANGIPNGNARSPLLTGTHLPKRTPTTSRSKLD
jgi:hypothetical protein